MVEASYIRYPLLALSAGHAPNTKHGIRVPLRQHPVRSNTWSPKDTVVYYSQNLYITAFFCHFIDILKLRVHVAHRRRRCRCRRQCPAVDQERQHCAAVRCPAKRERVCSRLLCFGVLVTSIGLGTVQGCNAFGKDLSCGGVLPASSVIRSCSFGCEEWSVGFSVAERENVR